MALSKLAGRPTSQRCTLNGEPDNEDLSRNANHVTGSPGDSNPVILLVTYGASRRLQHFRSERDRQRPQATV
jgi:hypothetical protein